MHVDPKKIEAMQDWPHPKTLKSLHGFLGLMGHYRNFVNNYGQIATPLSTLLKKNDFVWDNAKEKTFLALKESMCATLKLVVPFSIKLLSWNVTH
jgi:hypothetical protein